MGNQNPDTSSITLDSLCLESFSLIESDRAVEFWPSVSKKLAIKVASTVASHKSDKVSTVRNATFLVMTFSVVRLRTLINKAVTTSMSKSSKTGSSSVSCSFS